MFKFPALSVVIPVYNEGDSLRQTVTSIREVLAEYQINSQIIVINDGSTDDTFQSILDLDVEYVQHPQNRGYGSALITGVLAAKHEWIVITDADQTYPFSSICELLRFTGDYDMVVGARQGRFYHGSYLKRVLRIIFRFLVEFATGKAIPDINSGFRLFRRADMLEFEMVVSRGFSFTTTMTLLFFLTNKQIKYVPVDYKKRIGNSHVRLVQDGLRSLQFIFEAMLAYNPIKAFLLLSFLYLFGGCFIMVVTFACPDKIQGGALTLWSGTIGLMGLGFIASASRLSRLLGTKGLRKP
jgi:glycosyltransferase involved in cell wall biosynthesis